MNAVARQIALGDEAQDAAVDDQARGIEQSVLIRHGQTDRDDHPLRVRHDLGQHLGGHPLHARGLKRVLAAIARDAQLGQAKNADLIGLRGGDRSENPLPIAIPIERRLIQRHGRYFD